MPGHLVRATTFEEVVTGQLDDARRRCAELEEAVAERDAQISSLNGQLDHAEGELRAAASRADTLQRDKARVEARAAELFEEGDAARRVADKLRLKLELATANVNEAQLERDRAQSNLAKVTNVLAENQLQLHEVMSRDATLMTELNELRTLVDSHQDEIHVLSDARQAVQGAFEELKVENDRLRRELERANGPAPLPPEPVCKQVRNLVNVPR